MDLADVEANEYVHLYDCDAFGDACETAVAEVAAASLSVKMLF